MFRCVKHDANQCFDSCRNRHDAAQDSFRLLAFGIHLQIAVTARLVAGDALQGAKDGAAELGNQFRFSQATGPDRLRLTVEMVQQLMVERQRRLIGQHDLLAGGTVSP